MKSKITPNKSHSTTDLSIQLCDADDIGRVVKCTGRNVRLYAEKGIIPCIKIGPKLVRFHLPSVLKALGAGSLLEGGKL